VTSAACVRSLSARCFPEVFTAVALPLSFMRLMGGIVDEETIEASPAPKKPYVRPQLHELDGSGANGKLPYRVESGPTSGPS
jgi:hypothetical protein